MKLEESTFYGFRFDPPLEERSLIQCQECHKNSPWQNWKEEDCGRGHLLVCPNCQSNFEPQWSRPGFKPFITTQETL